MADLTIIKNQIRAQNSALANNFIAMDLPSWVTEAKLWGKIWLGDRYVPGAASIPEIGLECAFKDNKKPGEAGGGVVAEGLIPPKFTILSIISTGAEELALEAAYAVWQDLTIPSQRNSISIYHPMLRYPGISSCVINKIALLAPHPGQAMTLNIHCIAVSNAKTGASKKIGPVASGKQKVDPKLTNVFTSAIPPVAPKPNLGGLAAKVG